MGIPIVNRFQLKLKFRPYSHISSSILERVCKVEYLEASCSSKVENSEKQSLPMMENTEKETSDDPIVLSQPDMSEVSYDGVVEIKTELPPVPPAIEASQPPPESVWYRPLKQQKISESKFTHNGITFQHNTNVHALEIPRKLSRPKTKTKFLTDPIYDNVDDGHFICPKLGHIILRSIHFELGIRSDKISFSSDKDSQLLDKTKFGSDIDPLIKKRLLKIIRDFWYIFYPEGFSNPMIGYEFVIDVGSHTPHCRKEASYGTHEGKINMDHI